MTRRKFSREFKEQAVRRVIENDLPVAEVARELGVNATLLHSWKTAYLSTPGSEGAPAPKETSEELVKRLRRENERLRQERDFLKKAVGFFSQNPE
jgi:transposase